MTVFCFTGHRPDKLGGYNWNSLKNKDIMNELHKTITEVIYKYRQSGETEFKFIFGGALGIDQMAFYIVNEIKNSLNESSGYTIITEIAVPFEEQDVKWFEQDRKRWKEQLKQADSIVIVDTLDEYLIDGYTEGKYYPAKMQKRNEYMVNESIAVIAVWDGTSGGTANCVKYAQKHGKIIIRVQP